MNSDRIILAGFWILTTILLVLFIPKNKLREAIVVFLFKQFITWPLGLLVVELKLLEYPVRLFNYANKTSFSYEFFFYPATCSIFVLHYPRGKSLFVQFLYYSAFCTVFTLIEVILEKYTNLIHYLHWSWYITWSSLFITFYISFHFYLWFFKVLKKQSNQID